MHVDVLRWQPALPPPLGKLATMHMSRVCPMPVGAYPLLRLTVLAGSLAVAGALCPACETVVGGLRVQALSPTLVRVEPKGPRGFEDRATFVAVNRSFGGVAIVSAHTTANGTNVSTSHYSVLVRPDGSFALVGGGGKLLYDSIATPAQNLLHWPAPLTADVYAVEDRPRFVPPPWAPEPAPAGAPLAASSGYDFQNGVSGDRYVFLLGDTLEEWWASRGEYLQLTGPTPLLPDYAYGTWFTTWAQLPASCTAADTRRKIERWNSGGFPLDIFGLDMNWRLTNGTCCGAPACRSQRGTEWTNATHCEDHKYMTNTTDFPGAPPMQAWLQWMSDQKLHTYLNDHREYGLQTLSRTVMLRRISVTLVCVDLPQPSRETELPRQRKPRSGGKASPSSCRTGSLSVSDWLPADTALCDLALEKTNGHSTQVKLTVLTRCTI